MSTPADSNRTESVPLQSFDEVPAEAVVTRVAKVTGQSPLEMEPIFGVIDPDALNELFDSTEDRESSVTVTFDYCGQQITITADSIQLVPPDSTEK